MASNLSVIICTHNPRPDYLRRVLDALKAQTWPLEQWELLLIDNASKEPLAAKWDLSWHPQARHIREEELGLTPARLRGIEESTGELLVFVDDDNVLATDFLEMASKIEQKWFCIGVWGGRVQPEFEEQPHPRFNGYLKFLAVIDVDRIHFTTEAYGPCPKPVGAGMCVRRKIALKYQSESRSNGHRINLGRKGSSLISADDEDLRWMACLMGYGIGVFPDLLVTHLIPARRVQEEYLLRLYEDVQFSQMMVAALHSVEPYLSPAGIVAEFKFHLSQLKRPAGERQMRAAHRNASKRFRAWRQNSDLKASPAK
jgi:glycosyltransferase involved in cell wall biosynthesis